MLVTQGVIVFGLWSISTLNPADALIAVAGFAALVGFFGATQDIVIDAWRIERPTTAATAPWPPPTRWDTASP